MNIKRFISAINIVFALQLVIVALIAAGPLPREWALALGGIIVYFLLFSPIETGVLFFVRSIPFFIALPITADFDSLNLWRIALLALFLRWFFAERRDLAISPKGFPRRLSLADASLIILLLFAVLSFFVAPDPIAAAKRIIYFLNAGIIFFFVKALIRSGRLSWDAVGKNFLVPGIIVVLVGVIQLAMTYSLNIYQFVDFWARDVASGLYGMAWSERVMRGNTWFAYFYHSIKLRVFSTMTSSHTFALFVLLTFPYLAVFGYSRYFQGAGSRSGIKKTGYIIGISLFLLLLILSGTRGIWFAAAFPVIASVALFIRYRALRIYLKHTAAVFLLFLALFVPASAVYSSLQFQKQRGFENDALLAERFKSIIDLGETSNRGRIRIWRLTLLSIKNHPLLGVGIGNFPVILGEDIELAKAGSSAHNAYLQIAGEMGVIAGFAFLVFLLALLRSALAWIKMWDCSVRLTGLAVLLSFVWIFGYSLTDSSFFDARVLLGFLVSAGIVQGLAEQNGGLVKKFKI